MKRMESRIQVRIKISGIQYLESGIHGVQSMYQGPFLKVEFSLISAYGKGLSI